MDITGFIVKLWLFKFENCFLYFMADVRQSHLVITCRVSEQRYQKAK